MRATPGLRCLLAAALVLASGLTAKSAGPPRGLIAFDRSLDGSGRIHLIQPDGRGDRTLTPQPGFEAPLWSPDGSTLVYESGAGPADSDLSSYALSTGSARRLTRHAGSTRSRPGRRTARRSPGRRIAAEGSPSGSCAATARTLAGSRAGRRIPIPPGRRMAGRSRSSAHPQARWR